MNVITDGDSSIGSNYVRNTLRSSVWSNPIAKEISPEPGQGDHRHQRTGTLYIVATTSVCIITLDGDDHGNVNCPPIAGDWVHCSGTTRSESGHEGAVSASLSARVANVDMANRRFEHRGGRAIRIVPENPSGIHDRWGPGSDVLVTSHTDGISIVLCDAVHKPITLEKKSTGDT
jgi:hypothetical protein